MDNIWTPEKAGVIGGWTPAELRRFITNQVLTDPGALPKPPPAPYKPGFLGRFYTQEWDAATAGAQHGDYADFAHGGNPPPVLNPSFDVDLSSWPLTDTGAASVTYTRDTTIFRSSPASAKLVNTVAGSDDFIQQSFTVKPGYTYTFTVWVNVTAFTAEATGNRGIFVFSDDGSMPSNVRITGVTSGFTRFTVQHTPTDATMFVRLYAPQATLYYDDITLTETGPVWRMSCNGKTDSPLRWEYVGGAPLIINNMRTENFTPDATWHDCATIGPSFTPIRRGDYEMVMNAQLFNANFATPNLDISVSFGANAPEANNVVQAQAAQTGAAVTLTGIARFWGDYGSAPTIPVGQEIRMRYISQATAGTATARFRQLKVLPIRFQ